MKGPRKITLSTIALAVAAVLMAACIPGAAAVTPAGGASPATSSASGQAQSAAQGSGIIVQGQGSASATPDTAEIVLGVSIRAATVTEAQNEASSRMSQVIDRLTSLGIAKEQITTMRYSVFPQYAQNQVLTGYQVENMVNVKVKAVDRAGAILDGAVAAGANRVERVTLTIADPKPVASRAREVAMADAKAKADQLARLAGVGLGQAVSISETTSGLPSPRNGVAAAMPAEVAPPISAGEMEVRVSVQVSYAIQ